MKVLDLYERASRVPVLGKGAFSLAVALRAPYFLTIAPSLVELEPNRAVVRIRKWWGVHNHLGTVHAIAVANGLEMAMGVLAEATIPTHLRWIPKGMELEYLALSDSTLLATADTDPADWERPGEVRVAVRATREDGTVVVQGTIRLHTSEKKRAETVSASPVAG
ncbi:MAG TPA: hotdog fold domain-containing protein [Jatrophihabitans sp.]|uniref:hotdog fold domain-containing protein n=1 Tax=Jatrophihabitans sp. TaxID=1932789 RepID=UPI002DF8460E|nr:hotdog fold domain-containing protein [Jatrophihabitans sp.]